MIVGDGVKVGVGDAVIVGDGVLLLTLPIVGVAVDITTLLPNGVGVIEKPLLIDGDGITALCRDLQVIKARKAETIMIGKTVLGNFAGGCYLAFSLLD